MIYLDNAATTYIKPKEVYAAANRPFANAGRSGHKLALESTAAIEKSRALLADFFSIANPDRIVFCASATMALNFAIHGILKKGDHIIISGMEHNSVARPAISSVAEVSIAKADSTGFISLKSIEDEIRLNTKMIAVLHASNVTGAINPIAEIGKLARENGIIFLVDAAQTAGLLPINVAQMNIDLLAFPSHKHLFGVPGSGGLFVAEGLSLTPIIQGGTGHNSQSLTQCTILPTCLESGTQNTAAIHALSKGIEFINKIGINEIREHDKFLTSYLLENLAGLDNIIVYGPKNADKQIGTVSFNVKDKDCMFISSLLSTEFDIATRPGYHCAGLAHKSIGTDKIGTVRASLSYFNTKKDIDYLINALWKVAKN